MKTSRYQHALQCIVFRTQYDAGRSVKEIAQEAGVCESVVRRRLELSGLDAIHRPGRHEHTLRCRYVEGVWECPL